MKLLLVGLIISMIVYAVRLGGHLISSIMWIVKPNGAVASKLKGMGQTKLVFIVGGIEHWIVFASLLASTLLLY